MIKIRVYGAPAFFLFIAFTLCTPMAMASINMAPPSLDDPYYLGKVTYHRKLACGTCPLAKTTLTADKAKVFIQQLNTDKQLRSLLNDKERAAVAHYLNEYFGPR